MHVKTLTLNQYPSLLIQRLNRHSYSYCTPTLQKCRLRKELPINSSSVTKFHFRKRAVCYPFRKILFLLYKDKSSRKCYTMKLYNFVTRCPFILKISRRRTQFTALHLLEDTFVSKSHL